MATRDGLLHGTAVGHNENGPDNYSPWLNLAAAIVKQAAKDYISVLRRLWRKPSGIQQKRRLILRKIEMESFFCSGWCAELTDIAPDRIMQQCRATALEKEKAAIRRANRKQINTLLQDAD